MSVIAGALLIAMTTLGLPEASWCQSARVTGYVRTEYSRWTFDGTDILSDEPIAAASWNIPIGSYVDVADYGTVRIADRGMLGSAGHIDIAVWSRAEAFALTSVREICVRPSEQ